VEFAIENAQALKKRALRQTKVKEQLTNKRTPKGASEGQEAGPASHKEQRKRKRDDSEVHRSVHLVIAFCRLGFSVACNLGAIFRVCVDQSLFLLLPEAALLGVCSLVVTV